MSQESSTNQNSSEVWAARSAWSVLATRVTIVAVVLVTLVVNMPLLGQFAKSAEVPFNGDSIGEGVWTYGKQALTMLLMTALAALLAGMLATLLQTRGAYGFDMLKAVSYRRTHYGLFVSFFAVALALVVGSTVLYMIAPELLRVLSVHEVYVSARTLGKVAAKIIKLVAVIASCLAIGWLLVGWFILLVKPRRGYDRRNRD